MNNLQSIAEKEFYEAINKIFPEEAAQMRKHEGSGEYTVSDIRYTRLTERLEEFLREIRDKLSDLSPQGKRSMIDEYIFEANRWNEAWIKDKNDFLIKAPNLQWRIPNTNLNLQIIGKLISRLESHKERLPQSENTEVKVFQPISVFKTISVFQQKPAIEPEPVIEPLPVIKPLPSIESLPLIDPLTFIDPYFLQLFINAEKKANLNTGAFKTAIRCAAFCELLYEKKYIINVKDRRQKTMINFAKGRYGIDITNSLAASKKADRENHKYKTVAKNPPLIKCF